MRCAMLLAAAAALGCSRPAADGCGHGSVDLELDPGRGFSSLSEDGDVPVFIPPQGGIFTELDLIVRGIAVEAIEQVQVTIDADDGDRVADQSYPGFAVPLLCDGAGTAYAPRMPVRIAEGLVLEELEGVQGELALVVSTSRTDHARQWAVRLRVTGY